MELAQDRVQWRVQVLEVLSFRVLVQENSVFLCSCLRDSPSNDEPRLYFYVLILTHADLFDTDACFNTCE